MSSKTKKSKLADIVEKVGVTDLRSYELMIALKPLLPEDVRNRSLKKFLDIATANGGSMVSEDVWGKKHLAYKIGGHEEGYYAVYNLQSNPESITELDRELKLSTDVLRFIIVNK